MPVNTALRSAWRQEDCQKFEDNLGYIVSARPAWTDCTD